MFSSAGTCRAIMAPPSHARSTSGELPRLVKQNYMSTRYDGYCIAQREIREIVRNSWLCMRGEPPCCTYFAPRKNSTVVRYLVPRKNGTEVRLASRAKYCTACIYQPRYSVTTGSESQNVHHCTGAMLLCYHLGVILLYYHLKINF